jgi:3-oxoacyl-[acyl-carrier protein] reductase
MATRSPDRKAALITGAAGAIGSAIARRLAADDMTHEAGPEQVQRYRERIPLGYIGDPDDIAGAVIFLCSEAARYITGSTLDVNGGLLMR